MGRARRFVAAKLDRLSRSVVEFWVACREGFQARLVASSCSMPMLTTTAAGEFMASVLVSAAEYERRPIAQRTPAATDSGRRGLRAGQPPMLARPRCASASAGSVRVAGVFDPLQPDRTPTARRQRRGERGTRSTVRHVLRSCALDDDLARTTSA